MTIPGHWRLAETLGVDGHVASVLRGLMSGDISPLEFAAGKRRLASLHGRPYYEDLSPMWKAEIILAAMNEMLDAHGVEGVGNQSSGRGGFSYVNMGDMYAPTLGYLTGSRTRKDGWVLDSLGDLVERGTIPASWS